MAFISFQITSYKYNMQHNPLNYFSQLTQNNSKTNLAKQKLYEIQNVVKSSIQDGSIKIINETQNNQTRTYKKLQNGKLVDLKKKFSEREIHNLDHQIKHQKQLLLKNKIQISHIRSASHQFNKNQQNLKRISAAKMSLKWSKEREELQQKRIISIEKRNKEIKQEEIKLKQSQQKQQQILKNQRRKIIQQRINELKLKKQSRIQIINTSHTQIPLYLIAQKKFQQKQKQIELQKQKILKQVKAMKSFSVEELKRHEKTYLDKIKQRINLKAETLKMQNNRSTVNKSIEQKKNENNEELVNKDNLQINNQNQKKQEKQYIERIKNSLKMKSKTPDNISMLAKSRIKSQFDLYLNRKTDKINKQLSKMRRRQKFQQKIKKIPIIIDQQKRIEKQIAKDKSKNPLKYNFLLQKKDISQEKIYKQYSNFNIDVNPKILGKQYLEKLKQSPYLKNSKSIEIKKPDLSIQLKPAYKNYLPEIKMVRSDKKLNEIQSTKRIYKGNTKEAISALMKKSEAYEHNVLKKIQELKNINNYEDSVQKESQIDDLYMKSIKARIACLELK